MKKFFTLALALVSTISMFATVQSDLVLVFGQGTREIESYITVDDAASVPTVGNYASSLVQDGNIDMYALYQGKQFSALNVPSVVNVPIVVVSSIGATQDNYSFYVETYDETQLITITDLRPESGYPVPYTFNLADAAEYEFSLENEYVDGTHTVVADRFILNYTTASIKGTETWYGQGYDVDLALAADGQTATGTIDFAGKVGEWYDFKVVLGSNWIGDNDGFTRANNSRAISGNDNMWFEIEDETVDGVYTFTWTFATNTLTITYPDRVSVAQVTTNAFGWASFSYNADLEAIENDLKIYKGALAGDVLNLNEMNYVAADEGVIVYGTPSTTYHFAAGTGTSDFTGNDLKPASAWASHSGTIFVLHDEALYQYTGSDMPANKAYLQISSGQNPAPKHIRMVINGATAVDNVEAESVKAEKFVEDGQVYIRRGNEVFNLQGQKVNF